LAGITGIVFVDLDRRRPGDQTASPKVTFPTQYPVVPSHPSDIQQISSGVNEIVGKIKKVDFQSISDQLVTTTKSLQSVIAGPDMKKIVANLQSVTSDLAKTTAKIDGVVQGGAVEEFIREAVTTAKEAKQVIARIRSELEAINLVETARKTDRLLDGATSKTHTLAVEAQVIMENLRASTQALDELLERLSADPSEIIFSSPPGPGRQK
jgi:phospholipid/cholesterol/gamma-HCH transport system substrate-binding protein